MQCSQCGAENAAGVNFCAACGSPFGGTASAFDPSAAHPPAYGEPAGASPGAPQPTYTPQPQVPVGYAPQPAYPPQAPATGYATTPPVTTAPTSPPRKKRGCLIAALVLLGILLLGCAGVAFAATQLLKPKDLGVSYTETDYQSAVAKLGIQVVDKAPELPVEKTKIVYRGKKKVNVRLTSAEVSAAVAMHHRSPKWALQDVQILLGEDGQAMMSGYAVYNGQRYMFYSDITPKLAGPQTVTGTAQQIVVFGVDFPREYYSAAEAYLIGATNDWLAGMGEGLDIQTATITGGELVLVGTVPETAERVPLDAPATP